MYVEERHLGTNTRAEKKRTTEKSWLDNDKVWTLWRRKYDRQVIETTGEDWSVMHSTLGPKMAK